MLNKEKNAQAHIVWDTLYKCEVQATLNDWTEAQKADFIKRKLPSLKTTKKWAYKQLKRVASSGRISDYVDGVGSEMSKPNTVKTDTLTDRENDEI